MATVAQAKPTESRLNLWTKLVYGTGDWSISSFNTLRAIFYAFFLTDVVGLEPRLASIAAFVGILWDAINDPVIGTLSDRLKTRWGRRRPFLLVFAIPFGLAFLLQWWAPPWQNQIALMLTIMFAYMICDTLQTLVSVPYLSLIPEIAKGYDDRTSLIGYRMTFNFLASLVTAVAAPMIVDGVVKNGGTPQDGYFTIALIFGAIAVVPFLLIFAFLRERPIESEDEVANLTVRRSLVAAWRNIPWRFATVIYIFSWMTMDFLGVLLPFFLVYWIAGGDTLAEASVLGLKLPVESAILGVLQLSAIVAIPLWLAVSKHWSKRTAYIVSIMSWAITLVAFGFVQTGQVNYGLLLAIPAGLGMAAAHVLPESIYPDVIDWDELRTGERREGLYYGLKHLTRKISSALAIFLALQVLGWTGYRAPLPTETVVTQPEASLIAIRVLISVVGSALLMIGVIVAWFYPLSREKHTRIQYLLAKRHAQHQNIEHRT